MREEHAILDGTTLPPSDPFWNNYLPPLGWNCRCTTVQVRKDKYPRSNSAQAIAKGQSCTAKPKQQIFRFNPGKQEKIFPPKHPYLPKGCGRCQHKLSYDASNPNCQACRTLLRNMENEIKRREENRKEYERLKKDPEYSDVKYDEKSGGVGAIHKDHTFDKDKGWYETSAQNAGVKDGNVVILEKEEHSIYKKKNTEGLWNKKPFEIAANETGTENNIRNGLKHCVSKPNCKVAVLFFPKKNFDVNTFENALRKYNGLKTAPRQWRKFEEIICIQGENIVYKKSHIK